MIDYPKVNILGVAVSALSMPQALTILESQLEKRQPQIICIANTHTIMLCQSDAKLREVYSRATLVTPDGMPLVWLSWLNRQYQVERIYGPDLMLALCALKKPYRHFFYGATEATLQRLRANLKLRFPDLELVGFYAPPFRPLTIAEKTAVVDLMNGCQPDIVWVGLGAPKQEYWMGEYRALLKAPLLIGVGAAFDFHAGVKPQAPRWLQNVGLEWLFRLIKEPRRLWRRYVFTLPLFVALSSAQLLGIKRYRIP